MTDGTLATSTGGSDTALISASKPLSAPTLVLGPAPALPDWPDGTVLPDAMIAQLRDTLVALDALLAEPSLPMVLSEDHLPEDVAYGADDPAYGADDLAYGAEDPAADAEDPATGENAAERA